MISPKLVEVGRDLNIELLPNIEVLAVEGEPGRFKVRVKKHSRYVDLSKCTSCGECEKVCPIDVTDEYNLHLSHRKALYKKYPQAISGTYVIDKRGTAPCKATCPAHGSIQGYIILINISFIPPEDVKDFSNILNFESDNYGFAKTNPFNVVKTTREDVFVIRAFLAPKDIPQSVAKASTAGSETSVLLSKVRGSLARTKVYPEQRDVSEEESKKGGEIKEIKN